MTTKKAGTGNNKGKGEIQGSFPFALLKGQDDGVEQATAGARAVESRGLLRMLTSFCGRRMLKEESDGD